MRSPDEHSINSQPEWPKFQEICIATGFVMVYIERSISSHHSSPYYVRFVYALCQANRFLLTKYAFNSQPQTSEADENNAISSEFDFQELIKL